MKKLAQGTLLSLLILATAGCENIFIKPVTPPAPPKPQCECADKSPVQIPEPSKPAGTVAPEVKPPDVKIPEYSLLKPAQWEEVDGLQLDNLTLAWPAWMQGCTTLVNKPAWKNACTAAIQLNEQAAKMPANDAIQSYFKEYFSVYKTTNADGSDTGMITGYYEPLLKGSRSRSPQYPNPLYAAPNDMITVELDSLFPELKFKRVRGRLVGNKLVPYYSRAEIETDASPLKGREFIYIDDIIDVFFLQIQGSGLVQLDNGEQVHVGYADQNGHQYNSIGRVLVERGELTLAQVLLQPMHGLRVLPAARAVKKLGRLSMPQQRTLLEAMSGLERAVDVILVDASMTHPNGFSPFGIVSQEAVVVLSGSSSSITEAYTLIKKVSHAFARKHFRILVNKVRSQLDARFVQQLLHFSQRITPNLIRA